MRGKVELHIAFDDPFQDHPRLCGEKGITNSLLNNVPGSPPPMRGKVLLISAFTPLVRITPAYAGKRKSRHVD